ncbi:MAG: HEAT repeat domain-containing protein [Isosphaeraceae bacterium]
MPRALRLALLIALIPSATRSGGAEKSSLPQTAAGWTIELVTEGTEIAAPTAIVSAPDGRVYIGQNSRVLALQDGKTIVFTDTLGKVHGLEWADGVLFVAHGSLLSSFRDIDGDGGADRRLDLAGGLTPKRENATSSLDGCMGGIRLGLDGWIYVAVGDQGIPRAGSRGRQTIQLKGGGVIRVTADGSEIEVVSTGERNPRSVALSAAGDVFTFGSGDSSNRWPGGLTHHIPGGHYGYPYQFLTAPFRALPTMAAEAGREAGQGICYSDDGLPARYRGNLFFCDTSRQGVLRYEIRKAGGTYAIARATSLVTRGALADFHPVALTSTADGTGFWIIDRGQGENAPGRLYRLIYTANDRARPAPRPSGDDLATWIAALDHPAFSIRLAAQRRLARKGSAVMPELIRRLRTVQPEIGRLHALWALDAIGTNEACQAIREALQDSSPHLRLQAARNRGMRKDRQAVGKLTPLLADRDPAVRREAAIALGRCGDPDAIAPLLAALADADRFAAWAIRAAIRRLGYPDRAAMASALVDPQRRESALVLADESWSLAVVQALADALRQTPEPAVRGRIVACLAGQYRTYPEWTGAWWGPNPLAGPFPKKTVNWAPEGMETVLQGLRLGFADRDATVRFQTSVALGQLGPAAAPILLAGLAAEPDPGNQAAIVEALGELNDPAAIRQLTKLVTDATRPEPVRAAALDALARFRGPDILCARFSLVYDPKTPAALVARALPSLARDGYLPLNDLAGFLESPSAVVRAAALMSLNVKKAPPPEIKEQVLARLNDSSPQVRQAALLAVGALQMREAVPKLLEIAEQPDADLRTQAIAALCRMPDRRAVAIYRQASADSDPSLRRAGAQALQVIGGPADTAVVRAATTSLRLADPAALVRFALNHPGDPRAGEGLFFENKSLACGRCHAADGRGQHTPGPDLSGLGARSDRDRIIRSLLVPTAKVAAAHQAVQGSFQAITPLQLADLISFLQELKQGPQASINKRQGK